LQLRDKQEVVIRLSHPEKAISSDSVPVTLIRCVGKSRTCGLLFVKISAEMVARISLLRGNFAADE
jgi:hypothetical protein